MEIAGDSAMLSGTCGESLFDPGVENPGGDWGTKRGTGVETPRPQGNGCVLRWTTRVLLHNRVDRNPLTRDWLTSVSTSPEDRLPPPQKIKDLTLLKTQPLPARGSMHSATATCFRVRRSESELDQRDADGWMAPTSPGPTTPASTGFGAVELNATR